MSFGGLIDVARDKEAEDAFANTEPPAVGLFTLVAGPAQAVSHTQPLGDPLLGDPVHDHR